MCFFEVERIVHQPCHSFEYYSSITYINQDLYKRIIQEINSHFIPTVVIYAKRRVYENSSAAGVRISIDYMFHHQFVRVPSISGESSFIKLFTEELPQLLAGRMRNCVVPHYLGSLMDAKELDGVSEEDIRRVIVNLPDQKIKNIETFFAERMPSTTTSSNVFNLQLSSDKQQRSLSIKSKNMASNGGGGDLVFNKFDELLPGYGYVPNTERLFHHAIIENITDKELFHILAHEYMMVFKVLSYTGTSYTLDAYIYPNTFAQINRKIKLKLCSATLERIPNFEIVRKPSIRPSNKFQAGCSLFYQLTSADTPDVFEFNGILSEAFLNSIVDFLLYFKIASVVMYGTVKYFYVSAYMRQKDIKIFYSIMIIGMSHPYHSFIKNKFDETGRLIVASDKDNESESVAMNLFEYKVERLRGCYLFFFSYPKFINDLHGIIISLVDNCQESERSKLLTHDVFQAIIKNKTTCEYMTATNRMTPYIETSKHACDYSAYVINNMANVFQNTVATLKIEGETATPQEKRKRTKSTLNMRTTIDTLNSLVSIRPIGNITDVNITSSDRGKYEFKINSNAISLCLNAPLFKGSEDSQIFF